MNPELPKQFWGVYNNYNYNYQIGASDDYHLSFGKSGSNHSISQITIDQVWRRKCF